jgi:aspartate aminotransferase
MSIRLAARMRETSPSATAAVFARAAELRAAGVDLVSFAVGEPDFDTPKHIVDAAKRALDAGATRYTAVSGILDLRQAIADDSFSRRLVEHAANEVVVSTGAKQSLYNVAQTLFQAGDEVVIPTPSWVSYPDHARLAGALPVLVPCDETSRFLLTAEALHGAITERTVAVVLCSPSNPTGAAHTRDELHALAEVLRKRRVWIVLDEIYARLVYDGFEQVSLLTVAPDLRERVIIVDGVSKTYAMTGFRIGWMLAPREVAVACDALQSQVTTSANTAAQHAALAALTGPQDSVEAMRAVFERRRDRMLTALSAVPGLACSKPTGAFYLFVDLRSVLGKRAGDRTIATDTDFANWLLDDARVAVVPGSAFGTPGFIRLSYATSEREIDRGVERIAAAVASLA